MIEVDEGMLEMAPFPLNGPIEGRVCSACSSARLLECRSTTSVDDSSMRRACWRCGVAGCWGSRLFDCLAPDAVAGRRLELVVAGGCGTTGEPMVSEDNNGVVFWGTACSVVLDEAEVVLVKVGAGLAAVVVVVGAAAFAGDGSRLDKAFCCLSPADELPEFDARLPLSGFSWSLALGFNSPALAE